jgi:hypothetical protein
MHVVSRFVQQRLTPTNPVTAILVGAYGPRTEQLRDPCSPDKREALEQLTVKLPWTGFAPQRRYLDGLF